jgi:hypothetical protein
MTRPGRLALLLAGVGLVLSSPSTAGASYAPLDQPGPRLDVPGSALASSLHCTAGVGRSGRTPVLLVPATGVDPDQNYGGSWEPALAALGIPWCTVTLPYYTTGEMQTAAAYVVYAIRTAHARAGRRIAVMGHSQGGVLPRWALRFWPDTRRMVDDVVGLAPTNHGSTEDETLGTCDSGCAPATWQQEFHSHWMAAVSSLAETFAGISYTQVYTHLDEIDRPNGNDRGTASLHTGRGRIRNVALQDVCPANTSEHIAIGTVDAVAYALAIDALDHRGPANPARLPPSVCTRLVMPGVTQSGGAPAVITGVAGLAAQQLAAAPSVPSEPALKCYVTATCPGEAAASCLSRRAPIGPRNIGRVRLGFTRARARLRIAPRPVARTARSFRWCVTRSSGRVTAVFSSRSASGRARLVVTTARGHRLRGVGPGTSLRRLLRSFQRARLLSRKLYRAGPRSRRVFGILRGRVRFVAVAGDSLLRDRRLRRYLRRAGL